MTIRATTPRDFDSTIHRVIEFKRLNYPDSYKPNKEGLFQYTGISAESSIHYTEEALLALSNVEVVKYTLR